MSDAVITTVIRLLLLVIIVSLQNSNVNVKRNLDWQVAYQLEC